MAPAGAVPVFPFARPPAVRPLRAARRDPLLRVHEGAGRVLLPRDGVFRRPRRKRGPRLPDAHPGRGRPLLHERVNPSFTEPRADGELFKCVGVEWCEDLGEFLRRCGEASARQGDRFLLDSEEARDDYLYLSCLPWVDFTSVSQAGSFDRDDAVPHITWGKYAREGGRVTMPLSVTAHHAFCDGIHVGRFFDALQRMLDAL